jgi:hypothetical protein
MRQDQGRQVLGAALHTMQTGLMLHSVTLYRHWQGRTPGWVTPCSTSGSCGPPGAVTSVRFWQKSRPTNSLALAKEGQLRDMT